jgi:HD superfamily phosphohydrolase
MVMDALNERARRSAVPGHPIFRDQTPHRALHQLVSSQLDVDRMDYLNRDSFYTGVSEGVIGGDRIIKMLEVVTTDCWWRKRRSTASRSSSWRGG